MGNVSVESEPFMRILQKGRIARAWVSRSAIEAMFREADHSYPYETGGVLMGYWAERGTDVVVTQVLGPGPCAVHDETSFSPDGQFHELEIARIYAESGRSHTYLGDWHTHPASAAYLSRLDKATLKRIAAHAAARASSPVMAVLGGGTPWNLRMWMYVPRACYGFRISRVQALKVQLY